MRHQEGGEDIDDFGERTRLHGNGVHKRLPLLDFRGVLGESPA
jgi:hypothetical protein